MAYDKITGVLRLDSKGYQRARTNSKNYRVARFDAKNYVINLGITEGYHILNDDGNNKYFARFDATSLEVRLQPTLFNDRYTRIPLVYPIDGENFYINVSDSGKIYWWTMDNECKKITAKESKTSYYTEPSGNAIYNKKTQEMAWLSWKGPISPNIKTYLQIVDLATNKRREKELIFDAGTDTDHMKLTVLDSGDIMMTKDSGNPNKFLQMIKLDTTTYEPIGQWVTTNQLNTGYVVFFRLSGGRFFMRMSGYVTKPLPIYDDDLKLVGTIDNYLDYVDVHYTQQVFYEFGLIWSAYPKGIPVEPQPVYIYNYDTGALVKKTEPLPNGGVPVNDSAFLINKYDSTEHTSKFSIYDWKQEKILLTNEYLNNKNKGPTTDYGKIKGN